MSEGTVEPVAWMTDDGYVLTVSGLAFIKRSNPVAAERYSIPLFRFPPPAVTMADVEGLTRWEYGIRNPMAYPENQIHDMVEEPDGPFIRLSDLRALFGKVGGG